ncbi:MAG: FAD-binding protein, partial [Pseudomonadota bacterium]|nr:FAD-binding protein [Pseudomonadota bacterium]
GTRLIRGNALAARLYRSVVDLGVTVLRNSTVLELLRTEQGVTGVVYARSGAHVALQATRGVILATGGVSASMRFREMLMPHAASHVSMLPDGNSGDGVSLALAHGAVLGPEKLKNGCLTPVSVMKSANGDVVKYPHLAFDRCKPGSIMVDAAGHRFTNEAACYHDVVTAMHARGAVPAWLIGDRPFQRRYGMGLARPFPYPVRPLVRDGYLVEAASLEELARKIEVSPGVLAQTVARFNELARTGVDADFGRGGNAYDRSLGDVEHGPNPSLGEIRHGPFYALKLYPGDVGTFRGLRVNTNAQVTDAEGKVFSGLYACGLDMDSVFAGFYPGAGAMHGPNITFAYVAARHLAREDVSRKPSTHPVQAAA